jgi:hypothetical protein
MSEGSFLGSSITGGLPLVSVSTDDSIRLMHYVFQLGSRTHEDFWVYFDLGARDKNGYGLEKSQDGYCFWLACNKPFNGFTARPGFWAYKNGTSNEPCRWQGGGDLAWRPRRMFLTFDVAQRVVLQLYRNEPMRYDPEHWENTDDCVLEPPT